MRVPSRPAAAFAGGRALCAALGVAPIAALILCVSATAEPAAHNRCAAHGPDYVEAAGGERCVRIGGHVRAEMAHASESAIAPSLIGVPGGLAHAVADGVNGVSETIRAPAAQDSRLYRR